MPIYVCPLTHTIWGTPDDPAEFSSVALASIDNEIRSAEKGFDSDARQNRAGGSNSDRKKTCKKLDSLVVLIRARHDKSRSLPDLDKAIDLASEALSYTLPTDPESPARHHLLASLLSTRYGIKAYPNDLDAAIHHYDAALSLTSPTSPSSPNLHRRTSSGSNSGSATETWMYDLSQRLADRYEKKGDPADLAKAETMCRGALEMKGLDGLALAERQSHLAYLLQYKTQNLAKRSPESVNTPEVLLCIGLAKQALARLPPTDPRKTMYRLRLATYLNTSFQYTRNSHHLDEAIAIYDDEFPDLVDIDKASIPPTPPLSRASTTDSTASGTSTTGSIPPADDPSKPFHLHALGRNLLARFLASKTPNPQDLTRATSCFRRALHALVAQAAPDTHASAHPLWTELSCGLLTCLDKSGRKRVNVVVAGGGPVGQTCALAIALQSVERSMLSGGPGVQVTLYEARLLDDAATGGVRWRGAHDTPPNVRRQQVITLQDAVIDNYDKNGVPWSDIVWNKELNPEGGERVWPTSRQVPIRQVEDTITAHVQKDAFLKMCVKYKAKGMDADEFDTIRPTCDLFIGADGAGAKSFSINHPEFRFSRNTYFEEQMDRALGVFVDVPGPHRPQAKSVFLTISQTIYLLNSNYGTLGYLNIRLPGAYMSAMGDNETLESLASSESLLKRRIAFVIRGGLAMFDLPESSVHAINRIELPMSNSTRYLATAVRNPNANPREQPGRNATFPVVLAGDAAIKFNFWPGRGANSGLIGAYGLTTTLFDILPTIRPGTSIPVERFMLQVGLLSTLQVREHEGRGGYIQSINIDQRFEDVFGPHKTVEEKKEEPVLETSAQRDSSPSGLPIEPTAQRSASPSSNLELPDGARKPRGPRGSLPRTPSTGSLAAVAENGSSIPEPPDSPPIYTGAAEEYDKITELVSQKKMPDPAEVTPLAEAVEVVRSATRRAKGRRGAPMSANRRKTILERAKTLDLPEQGFILDAREMEALMQYDVLVSRELLNRLQTRRDTFQQRPEWLENHVTVSDPEFDRAVKKLHPALKKLIFLSEPWPTGKMNPQGWEVDPKIYRQPGIARN